MESRDFLEPTVLTNYGLGRANWGRWVWGVWGVRRWSNVVVRVAASRLQSM